MKENHSWLEYCSAGILFIILLILMAIVLIMLFFIPADIALSVLLTIVKDSLLNNIVIFCVGYITGFFIAFLFTDKKTNYDADDALGAVLLMACLLAIIVIMYTIITNIYYIRLTEELTKYSGIVINEKKVIYTGYLIGFLIAYAVIWQKREE